MTIITDEGEKEVEVGRVHILYILYAQSPIVVLERKCVPAPCSES